ncbi:MAG: Stp1/IreP family PP2C-type Ser/Thr phosphatase [Anaerolineae bacterium]|nr:Stp1/IreP family PP2C-type Ser/Thr phosphatase [Anaerolineae bacterium]
MLTCQKCGGQNRRGAKFCSTCGADLSPTRSMSPAEAEKRGSPKSGEGVASSFVRFLTGSKSQPAKPPQPAASATPAAPLSATKPMGTEQPPVSLTPLPPGSVLSHPQDPTRRYAIAKARELEHSIYYDALDLNCPSCQTLFPQMPSYGMCPQCQAPLDVVLIHERLLPPGGLHPADEVEKLVQLSAGHANILPHRDILQYQEHIYTVAEHPGRWGVLVRGRRQRLPDEALAETAQVAQALAYLHSNGFAHSEVGGEVSVESLIVVGGARDAKLADLGACVPLPTGDSHAVRAQINRDITFLGRLLFYLATNKELSRSSIEFAPPALRPFIERAMQNQYATVADMLTAFSLLPSAPAAGRSLKASHGQATHPGQKHARNEDAVITFTYDKEQDGQTVPIGFYLVADGMGGHDAGDLASRTVNQVVTDRIIKIKVLPDLRKSTRKLTQEDVPADILSEAVQKANETLMNHGQKKSSDLGSTVTSALVIGDVATVANVGDSRTYLLRDGRMEQISQDHSLVARLVDAGIVTPEEVRSHPQRNQIYRCLGHQPTVEVDTFPVQLQEGDRLILCSDGLWEMVPDAEVQHIVESARSPQKACDALIEAANQAGGEDNIAVIVVELE